VQMRIKQKVLLTSSLKLSYAQIVQFVELFKEYNFFFFFSNTN